MPHPLQYHILQFPHASIPRPLWYPQPHIPLSASRIQHHTKWHKMVKIVKAGQKNDGRKSPPKNARKKMPSNGQKKRQKIAQTKRKWPKMTKSGQISQKWSERVQKKVSNDQKAAKNNPKWPKVAKAAKTSKNGQKWPKCSQLAEKCTAVAPKKTPYRPAWPCLVLHRPALPKVLGGVQLGFGPLAVKEREDMPPKATLSFCQTHWQSDLLSFISAASSASFAILTKTQPSCHIFVSHPISLGLRHIFAPEQGCQRWPKGTKSGQKWQK